MSTTTERTVHTRWMIRRDVQDALPFLGVEEETVVNWMKNRNTIGMVVEDDDHLTGAMVYALYPTRTEVLAIGGDFKSLTDLLKHKAERSGRKMVECFVSEYDDVRIFGFATNGFTGRLWGSEIRFFWHTNAVEPRLSGPLLD